MAEELKLDLGLQLPLEQLAIAALQEWGKARGNMRDDLRARWDELGLLLVEPLIKRLVAKLNA